MHIRSALLGLSLAILSLPATGMQVESSLSGYPLANGNYAANGYLDFYENNSSTTRKAIYINAGLTLPAFQPIRLNSSGQPMLNGAPTTLYGNGIYTVKLRNSSGSVVWIRNGLNYSSAQVVDFGGLYVDMKATYGQTNAALGNAITALGTTENTLVFQKGAYTVTSPKTFQSNLTLKFMQGAYLDIAAGVAVSILGNIDAGEYQIFKGLGKDDVTIATSANSTILKDWYGLQGASQVVTSLSATYVSVNLSLIGTTVATTINVTELNGVNTSVGGMTRLNQVSISGDTRISGNVNISGNINLSTNISITGSVSLFSWVTPNNSFSTGVNYRATTDCFVTAYGYSNINTVYYIDVFSDALPSPTTLRVRNGGYAGNQNEHYATVLCPIRQGDYFRVDASQIAATVINMTKLGK